MSKPQHCSHKHPLDRQSLENLAYAQLVRDRMGQIMKAHSLGRARLFFYGPLSLSVFLGQQLTSVGEIQLFEYQDPGYVASCTLRS